MMIKLVTKHLWFTSGSSKMPHSPEQLPPLLPPLEMAKVSLLCSSVIFEVVFVHEPVLFLIVFSFFKLSLLFLLLFVFV